MYIVAFITYGIVCAAAYNKDFAVLDELSSMTWVWLFHMVFIGTSVPYM